MGRLPAAQRREQLLDTAARVFAVHGFSGATTFQIAKAAGVSEPIIYRHFESKRDLFIALVERTGAATIKLWEHELATAPDPAERLKRLIGANPMVANRGRGIYRVIVQAMTEVEDPKILAALTEHVGRLHAFLVAEVRLAQEGGFVSKRFSPELSAWALMQVGLGFGVLGAMGVTRHVSDEQGQTIVDLLGALMLGANYRREA